MRSSLLWGAPLLLALTVLQTAVLPRFPVFGLTPSLPFLVALAWGLLRGPNEGVIWAFLGGLLMDIFSIAPTGGSALTYMAAILSVIVINQALPTNRFVMPMLLAALATLIQQVTYLLFLALFGFAPTLALATRLLPLTLMHAIAILPIYWSMFFVERTLYPQPVEV